MNGQWDPDWVVRPGVILDEEMQERGLTADAVASACDLDVEVMKGLLAGTEPLTPEIAASLSVLLGTSATLWLNLEQAYRSGLAKGKKDLDA